MDKEIISLTTYAERESIFAKDYLTITDIQKLLGITYAEASARMSIIRMYSDRLKIRSKIHVQDYLDFYNLPASERYCRNLKDEDKE